MKIEFLYQQGSASFPEDAIICQPPHHFGVADGVTAIKGLPQIFKNERTPGQFASFALSSAFANVSPTEKIEDILIRANSHIRQVAEEQGLNLRQAELLPSAVFAIGSIHAYGIHILQAGDSLAVWEKKDGSLDATSNLAFGYEQILREYFTKLMAKHNGALEAAQKGMQPILTKARRTFNSRQSGFAVLNGQPTVKDFWQSFFLSPEKLSVLIFLTDGLVPFDWTENPHKLAREVIGLYRQGGLSKILKITNAIARQKKQGRYGHKDIPEATGLAIEF